MRRSMSISMRWKMPVLLFVGLLAFSKVQAGEREQLLFMEIEPVIISATKHPQPLKDAPAIATVISSKEIRNMGARNLLDVLKRVPGIGVSVVLGYGKFGIESRGIKSDFSEKVLVMIDGHRVNESIRGTATWHFGDMTVENIKRVEVIRGPGSALHGANAFVAVINVVTKDAEDIDGTEARVGGGSYDTQHYNLLYGKADSDLKVTAMVDHIGSDGARMYVDSDAAGRSGRTDDWLEKTDVALKMSKGDLSFNLRYLDKNEGGYIGAADILSDESEMESKHLFGDIKYKHSFGDDIVFNVKAYFDQFDWNTFIEVLPEDLYPPDGMIGTPEVKNSTYGLEVQLDYTLWDSNTLTVGALYEDIKQYDVRQSTNYDPLDTSFPPAPLGSLQNVTSWGNWNQNKSRYVSALYIQDVWQVTPDVEATLGIRHDRYNDFGNTTNPRLGVVWSLSEKTSLKLLYGEAFRAPNFVELYNTNNPVQSGNSELKPEEIRTYEASIGHQFSENFRVDITYFNSEIKDIIKTSAGQFENLEKNKVDGVEVELRTNFNKISYGYVNYTYQSTKDVATGSRLPEVARHKGNLGFNVGLSRHLNVNANILAVGSRPREAGDTRGDLDGYEVVDLTLIARNFHEGLEIRGSVYNLFDEDYADPAPAGTVPGDYPRAGRSYMFELAYKF